MYALAPVKGPIILESLSLDSVLNLSPHHCTYIIPYFLLLVK